MELREIVTQAQQGDESAFERLVNAHRDMALGYARSLVASHDAAQDAVQEALVIAHRNLSGLQNPNAFEAWLRSIVRFRCLRSSAKHSETTLENIADVIEQSDLESETFQRLAVDRVLAAIDSLPTLQIEVLRLFYADELSQAEIAARLELSVGTVNMRLHAARSRLRRRLTTMNETPLPKTDPAVLLNLLARLYLSNSRSTPCRTSLADLIRGKTRFAPLDALPVDSCKQ